MVVYRTRLLSALIVFALVFFSALILVSIPTFAPAANAADMSDSIDTVTDADVDSGGSHTLFFDNSDSASDFVLSGDQPNNGAPQTSAPGGANQWWISNMCGSSACNANYPSSNVGANLLPPGTGSHNGAVAFKQQVDMKQNWTLNFDMNIQKLNANGAVTGNGAGDFLGFVLTPVSPSRAGTGQDAGGLGIAGLSNTFAWGIDFYDNTSGSAFTSPSYDNANLIANPGGLLNANPTQIFGFRHTDASGNLTNPNVVAAPNSATEVSQECSFNSLAGVSYTQNSGSTNWGPNNTPQIVANVDVSWTYSGSGQGVLTAVLNSSSNCDTAHKQPQASSHTGQTFTYTVPLTTNSMSVAMAASDGGMFSRLGVTINTFTTSIGTGTTNVTYKDQAGNALRTPTSFIANTGEDIGISPQNMQAGSPNNATDDITFTAPVFPGYYLASVPDVTVSADSVSGGVTTPGNSMPLQYQAEYQSSSVTINYPAGDPNAASPIILDAHGVTGQTFNFNVSSSVPQGYHLQTPSQSTISGTYDTTENCNNSGTPQATTPSACATVTNDLTPQAFTAQLVADVQTLNINYTFPSGHDLSSSLTPTQISQNSTTAGSFQSVSIPQVDGYTSYYTTASLNSGAATASTSIPAIAADSTPNGASTSDSSPQTAMVTYVANPRSISVSYGSPCSSSCSETITQSSSSTPYTADSSYDAVPITQISGYTSYVSVNGATASSVQTFPAGVFGASNISLNVSYTAWTGAVKFYTVQQDSSNANIGAVTLLPGASSSASGLAGTNFSVTFGSDTSTQTTNLQAAGGVPAGYHVTSSYWSDNPSGGQVSQTPPYTDDWTWNDMTNVGTGSNVDYQAAIVFAYTADSQTANVTISGAPSGNSQGVVDGTTPYTGATASVQVVNVTQIPGYTLSVTDSLGNAMTVMNNQFTISYDSTSNGTSSTDSSPQQFTILYTAVTSQILVDYTYQTDTSTNVAASTSTDTTSYTAPNLPNPVQIDTQTGGQYSLSIPNITGYTWAVTDGTTSWDSSSLPSSFTSDGTQKTYTVIYTPATSTVTINYYEATYNASGAFAYTRNAVPGTSPTALAGVIGKTVNFSVNSNSITVPPGWQLDPMNAALAQVNDSTSASDADGLNGGSAAKVLTVQASPTSYIVYMARDIQSAQVSFTGAPSGIPTVYSDGRTGESYTVSTAAFAIPGYTYTITAPTGGTVSQISGTYDTTSNANATLSISNNGDGDSSPQVYTVTYTADFQQAKVQADSSRPSSSGGATTLETVNGTTGAAINFTTTDASLEISGYTYLVQGPNSLYYATLQQANAANKTFDATDNTGTQDAQVQVFNVHYTPNVQQAVLQTGASDPNGAHIVETTSGVTAGTIAFTTTDSALNMPGYTYQVQVGGSDYATLNAAVAANSTYDNTNNGASSSDSSPQSFVVNYMPSSQSVTVHYVYASGSTASADVTQTKVTNAAGDAITSPTISGYTPSSTSVTPSFAVDSSGDLITPTITVTYTPDPQTCTLSYQNDMDMDIYKWTYSAPTSLSGKTDQVVLNTAPAVPGYTFSGFYANGSSTLSAPALLSSYTYSAGANSLLLQYTANPQSVTINYVYSDNDGSATQGLGMIPAALLATPSNPQIFAGSSNGPGATDRNPTLTGYTPSTQDSTVSFAVNSDGNLVTPVITVTYSASTDDPATIYYQDLLGNDISTKAPTNPTTSSTGTTTEPIPSDGVVDIPGYTINTITYNSTDICSPSGAPCTTAPDLSNAVFTGGATGDSIRFIYEPNPQTVVVHYQYASGPRAGQDFCTDSIAASTNATTPNSVTAGTIQGTADPAGCGSTPVGYTLSSPSSQNISWAVNSSGTLVTPEEFFYFAASSTSAVIDYGVSGDGTALNSLLPSSTISGTQNGSTGEVITTSGAVSISGYTFSALEFNGAEVATTVQDANAFVAIYTASSTPGYQDTLQYIYTPNSGTTTYHFVDTAGNTIYPDQVSTAFVTGDAITNFTGYDTIATGYTYSSTAAGSSATMPASGAAQVTYIYTGNFQQVQVQFQDLQGVTIAATQTINGTSGAVIDYATNSASAPIDYNTPGYTLSLDGRESTTHFDTTSNADTTDTSVQTVTLAYSADTQSVHIYGVVGEVTGKRIFAQTLAGVTAQSVDYSGVEKAVAGYTLTNDGTSLPANATFNADESTDQDVYLIFTPDVQDVVLSTDSSDPNGAQTICQVEGYTGQAINFAAASPPCSDASLRRPGYSYTVTGPDDALYSNLTQAIAANQFFDTTDNDATTLLPPYAVNSLGLPSNASSPAPLASLAFPAPQSAFTPLGTVVTADDTAAQEFEVHYNANTQSAFVETVNDPSGNITYQVVTGLTSAAITSLGVTDADLDRPGFTYYVQGPNGVQYATLADALVANPNFDADDSTNQVFTVVYDTPPVSTPNIQQPPSPPPPGTIVPTDPGNESAGSGTCTVAAFNKADCINRGGLWTPEEDSSAELPATGLDFTGFLALLAMLIFLQKCTLHARRKSVL